MQLQQFFIEIYWLEEMKKEISCCALTQLEKFIVELVNYLKQLQYLTE